MSSGKEDVAPQPQPQFPIVTWAGGAATTRAAVPAGTLCYVNRFAEALAAASGDDAVKAACVRAQAGQRSTATLGTAPARVRCGCAPPGMHGPEMASAGK